MKFLPNQKGFTLIQLAVAVAIIAIVSGIALLSYKTISDQSKYEETRQKMALLQKGIMGDPIITEHGERISFGYLGDMGALPAALTELVTPGTAWQYNPTGAPCNGTCNEGAGWRGPYIKGDFSGSTDYLNDGWGNPIIYTPAANSFILTSYGPDGVAGTGDDVVLAVNPVNLYAMGATNPITVQVTANGAPITNAIVALFYPATNGTVASTTLNGGLNGTYSFNGVDIPYGTRSLMVTGRGTYGSTPVNVYNGHLTFNIDLTHVGGAGMYLILDPMQTSGFTQVGTYTLYIQNIGATAITLRSFTASFPAYTAPLQAVTPPVHINRIRVGGTSVYSNGNYLSGGAQTAFNAGTITVNPGATVTVTVRLRDANNVTPLLNPSGIYTTTFYDQAVPPGGGTPYDFTFTVP